MLPETVYTTAQVRELDRIAIEDHGIPGYELMQRAGKASFKLLKEKWPVAKNIQVYCGLGNNGGDGYVIARLAKQAGLSVEVIQLGNPSKITGDALKAQTDWRKLISNSGLAPTTKTPDVIIDAIFGTGLTRPPAAEWLAAINTINASAIPVLAIDVPSGLNSDTGMPLGTAVAADATISFIGIKLGLLTGKAGDFTGEISFDRLDIPEVVYDSISPTVIRLNQNMLSTLLPPRKASTHKGDCGHVLLIGGMQGMSGAIRMAAEASARSGAGLITLASEDTSIPRPEIMSVDLSAREQLTKALQRSSVIAIGPGLGTSVDALDLFKQAIKQSKPMVVDADALSLLAQSPRKYDKWILTPHPGEAARLLNISTTEIQHNRPAACKAIQQRYGGVCVLKGFGSLLCDGEALAVSTNGNPGMASGGMGDILCGIIAGLLAQKLTPMNAAKAGVFVHANAADKVASTSGQRGMLATDLFPFIQHLVNPDR